MLDRFRGHDRGDSGNKKGRNKSRHRGGKNMSAREIDQLIVGSGTTSVNEQGNITSTTFFEQVSGAHRRRIGESLKRDPMLIHEISQGARAIAEACLLSVLTPEEKLLRDARSSLPREWLPIVRKLVSICTVSMSENGTDFNITLPPDYIATARQLVGAELGRMDAETAKRRIERSQLLQVLRIKVVSAPAAPTPPPTHVQPTMHAPRRPSADLLELIQPIDVSADLTSSLPDHMKRTVETPPDLPSVFLSLVQLSEPYKSALAETLCECTLTFQPPNGLQSVSPEQYSDTVLGRIRAHLVGIEPDDFWRAFQSNPEMRQYHLGSIYASACPDRAKLLDLEQQWHLITKIPDHYRRILDILAPEWEMESVSNEKIEIRIQPPFQYSADVQYDLIDLLDDIPREQLERDVERYSLLKQIQLLRIRDDLLEDIDVPTANDATITTTVLASVDDPIVFNGITTALGQPLRADILAGSLNTEPSMDAVSSAAEPIRNTTVNSQNVMDATADLVAAIKQVPDDAYLDGTMDDLADLATGDPTSEHGDEILAMRQFNHQLSLQMEQAAVTIWKEVRGDLWIPGGRREIDDMQDAVMLRPDQEQEDQALVMDLEAFCLQMSLLLHTLQTTQMRETVSDQYSSLISQIPAQSHLSVLKALTIEFVQSRIPILSGQSVDQAVRLGNEVVSRYQSARQYQMNLIAEALRTVKTDLGRRLELLQDAAGSLEARMMRENILLLEHLHLAILHYVQFEEFSVQMRVKDESSSADAAEVLHRIPIYPGTSQVMNTTSRDQRRASVDRIALCPGVMNSVSRQRDVYQFPASLVDIAEDDQEPEEGVVLAQLYNRAPIALHRLGGPVAFQSNLIPIAELPVTDYAKENAAAMESGTLAYVTDYLNAMNTHPYRAGLRAVTSREDPIELIGFSMGTQEFIAGFPLSNNKMEYMPDLDEGLTIDGADLTPASALLLKQIGMEIKHPNMILASNFSLVPAGEQEGDTQADMERFIHDLVHDRRWNMSEVTDLFQRIDLEIAQRGGKPGVQNTEGRWKRMPFRRARQDGFMHARHVWKAVELSGNLDAVFQWLLEHDTDLAEMVEEAGQEEVA